ncbi:MAG TPA: 2-C-methyl-D-erythritol 4-phosphate cytidylyltransferase, partial [Mycobacteriales bacterium]
MPRDTVVLVPAAGRGERLGPGAPKALRALRGDPLLLHAVRRIAAAESVAVIVVAAPPGAEDAVRAMLAPVSTSLVVVAGGVSREESVGRALAAAPAGLEVVLVHDAARCLCPPELADEVAAAVRAGHDAVVPVLPVTDTVKQVDGGGA